MLMLYLLLVVALYAFVRLVQIPLECSRLDRLQKALSKIDAVLEE